MTKKKEKERNKIRFFPFYFWGNRKKKEKCMEKGVTKVAGQPANLRGFTKQLLFIDEIHYKKLQLYTKCSLNKINKNKKKIMSFSSFNYTLNL